MNLVCCNYKCGCTALAVVVSLIIGVIGAFLQITGVIALGTVFLLVAAGVAAVYLGALVLATLLTRRREYSGCECAALNVLLAALLAIIALAALLLAVGITATSVISAILVGLLIAAITLAITVSVCLVRCLTDCRS